MVVDASALDTRAITFRRGVVDADHQPLALDQRLDNIDGRDSHQVGFSADRTDGGVSGTELVGDAGGAKPGGDRAAASGEEDAGQQQRQSGGAAFVEPVG
jgi:hypothetical protein